MDKKTSIFGIILVVLGALLLLSRFQIHLFQFLLPAALIILGVWFIWRKRNGDPSIPPPPLPDGYYKAPGGTPTAGMPPHSGTIDRPDSSSPAASFGRLPLRRFIRTSRLPADGGRQGEIQQIPR